MYLGIDPWVRKLGYALIDDDLKIIDAGILLQDQKSPTREDQFNRANQIFDFFSEMLKKYYSPRAYSNRAQKIYHMKWKGRQNVGSKDN